MSVSMLKVALEKDAEIDARHRRYELSGSLDPLSSHIITIIAIHVQSINQP